MKVFLLVRAVRYLFSSMHNKEGEEEKENERKGMEGGEGKGIFK